MAHEYATRADLKATLEIGSESFADLDIDLALTAASRSVDQTTGRRFWADADATQVRYYTPAGSSVGSYPDRLWIDDLVTLTTFQVDPGGDGTFEETWVQNTDFLLEPLNAAADLWPWTTIKVHPRSSRYLPWYDRSVKVTGKFGWAEIPDSVVMATKIIASKLVKRAREAPFGVVALGLDGAAVRIASQDIDVRDLLAAYVRHQF